MKTAKAPDAAWTVMQSLTSASTIREIVKLANGGLHPARRSLMLENDLRGLPFYSEFAAVLTSPLTTYGTRHERTIDLRAASGKFILDATLGKIPPQTALQQAQAAMQAVLSK